jgi:hypothetical protein
MDKTKDELLAALPDEFLLKKLPTYEELMENYSRPKRR